MGTPTRHTLKVSPQMNFSYVSIHEELSWMLGCMDAVRMCGAECARFCCMMVFPFLMRQNLALSSF